MFHVPESLMQLGVSVVTTDDHTSALGLKTVEGINLYTKRRKLYDMAKANGNIEKYRCWLRQEFNDATSDMTQFINDQSAEYKMDENDPYGWVVYYRLLDRWTVGDWFANKMPIAETIND